MINYADENLFLQDSVDKQISIVSDDQTINITNADIVGESVTIKESITSEENLYYGAVESNCIKFTVKNTMPRMMKKWITVTITPHGASEPFVLGRYYVRGDKPSSDRSTREITAYDGLYKILTNTYKKWYNSLWTNGVTTMTVKQFRDAWFERLHSTHSWLEQETTTLPNDDLVLRKSRKIQRPSGRDIFKAICEINGCFGHIGRDNKFHYIRMPSLSDATEIVNTYTISVEYEDYFTSPIDRVEILSPDGEVLGDYGVSEDEAENKYVVESNFMLKGIGGESSSIARERMEDAATKLYNEISSVVFRPFSGEFKGNPCYEVGDPIICHAGNQDVRTIILNRELKGIQSLHDVYSATGSEEYPEKQNTLSNQIKGVKQSVDQISDTTSGYDAPSSEDGDMDDFYIKYADHVTKTPKITVENTGEFVTNNNSDEPPENSFKITDFEWDNQVGGYHIKASGNYCYGSGNWHTWDCIIKGLFTAPGTYRFECDAKWTAQGVREWTFDTVPRITTWTHSDSVRDVPVDMVHFGDPNTDDQFHHYIGNTFSIQQRDFEGGDFLFWFGPGMPVQETSALPYIEVEITGLRVVYIDPETHEPDPDGGVETDTEKYIDHVYVKAEDESGNKVWKEIEYVAGADTSSHSGLALNYKRWLSLTPEVMRAWFKADPPQATQSFNRYCLRYTGEPDKTLTVKYEASTAWTKDSCKKTKEHVYTITNHGAYESGSVQQIAYKIEGLTSGKTYWFNFWAKFSGAEFGEDFDKGLGLVWSTTNSINTDDWTGNPNTYNDTTKYLSFYRVNAKRYYEAGVKATASTMYMILTVGDLTDGDNIHLTLGDMVIAQEQKKYARSIYLFDVETETWVKYKPFGSSNDDGESEISYLSELNDVEIGEPIDGQVLTFRDGNWVNADGGVDDYDDLDNKPKINDVTLIGNSTTRDLGMIEEVTLAEYNAKSSTEKMNPDKVFYIKDAGGSGGGGGSGSTVIVTPILDTGVPIATITVDGVTQTLYAPAGGGGTSNITSAYTRVQQTEFDSTNVNESMSNYTLISDPNA